MVPVGSWQSWHVPRLSTLRSRLSPTGATAPPGYFMLAELAPGICALEPCATWHVMQFRDDALDVWRYVKIASVVFWSKPVLR